MPSDKHYRPERRSRPRTKEPLVLMNLRLPRSARSKLLDYSASVRRSAAWVVNDLIDSLPKSLVLREQQIALASPKKPSPQPLKPYA